MIELTRFFLQDTYCYTQLTSMVNVSIQLLLYAHLPPAILSLVAGLFVYRNEKKLESRVFLALALVFFFFTIGDLVEWFVFLGPSAIMFARASIEVIDPLLFILGSYLLYVLVAKKDVRAWVKFLWLATLLPLAYRAAIGVNLASYNWYICEANESYFSTSYIYYVDLFYMTAALLFAAWSIFKTKGNRLQVAIASTGVCAFLALFFVMEYVFTGYIFGAAFDYNYFLYAFAGMPILIAFLAYLTIRYKTFNLKVITTEVGMAGMFAFVLAQYFFLDNKVAVALNTVAVIALSVLSFIVVRSVRTEIAHREEIERLAVELNKTNNKQEVLIHFIGHEVKGFLTKDAGAFASLSEGDFGELSADAKRFVDAALEQTRRGVESVSYILKASDLKKGTVAYVKQPFDLKALTQESVDAAKTSAEHRGLVLTFTPEEGDYTMVGDAPQIKDHVLRNLIENAIYYTTTGSVTVHLSRKDKKLVCTVTDTGVGITPEDMKVLFTEGGHGKDSVRTNVHSTGYGLFIAKEVAEAMNGTIKVESAGEGKGSTFTLEFPAA